MLELIIGEAHSLQEAASINDRLILNQLIGDSAATNN